MATQGNTVVSKVKMDDGASIHIEVLGENSTKIKPLLISLHVAPGLSTHLEPEASYAFLSDKFRVLVYDVVEVANLITSNPIPMNAGSRISKG